MNLPNPERASIPPEKLRDYLLNPLNPRNRGKARLFGALGYVQDKWESLEADIRKQHLSQNAIEGRPTVSGRTYSIVAPLRGPIGSAIMRQIWQIDHDSEVARFLTAYPA